MERGAPLTYVDRSPLVQPASGCTGQTQFARALDRRLSKGQMVRSLTSLRLHRLDHGIRADAGPPTDVILRGVTKPDHFCRRCPKIQQFLRERVIALRPDLKPVFWSIL